MRRWTRGSTEEALAQCSRIRHRNRVRWPFRFLNRHRRIIRANAARTKWQ